MKIYWRRKTKEIVRHFKEWKNENGVNEKERQYQPHDKGEKKRKLKWDRVKWKRKKKKKINEIYWEKNFKGKKFYEKRMKT